ncbi:MAG TPA: 30S ribosome-binding factor RbfA [Pirellulales bacterium]
MSSRRLLKAAEAIREVVSFAIVAELRDPRVRLVTVTHVEVSPDMRHAKVHVSVMGNEAQQQLSLRGLQSAAGFLQAKIAERIDTRYTPRLLFVLDEGVKKSIEMARILKQVLPTETDDEHAIEQATDDEAIDDGEGGEESPTALDHFTVEDEADRSASASAPPDEIENESTPETSAQRRRPR